MSAVPDDKALSSDTRSYDDMATESLKKSDTAWMSTYHYKRTKSK